MHDLRNWSCDSARGSWSGCPKTSGSPGSPWSEPSGLRSGAAVCLEIGPRSWLHRGMAAWNLGGPNLRGSMVAYISPLSMAGPSPSSQGAQGPFTKPYVFEGPDSAARSHHPSNASTPTDRYEPVRRRIRTPGTPAWTGRFVRGR